MSSDNIWIANCNLQSLRLNPLISLAQMAKMIRWKLSCNEIQWSIIKHLYTGSTVHSCSAWSRHHYYIVDLFHSCKADSFGYLIALRTSYFKKKFNTRSYWWKIIKYLPRYRYKCYSSLLYMGRERRSSHLFFMRNTSD